MAILGKLYWTPRLVKLSHANFKDSKLANERNVIEVELWKGKKPLGALRLGKASVKWNGNPISIDDLATHLNELQADRKEGTP